MSENLEAKPRRSLLNLALWGAALIGVAVVLYIIVVSSRNPAQLVKPPSIAAAPETHDVAKKLEHPADGAAPPAYGFNDAKGKRVTAADFKGKVVVMNLWATWCAPCKLEMPTLARLAKEYAGKPVVVLPVSVDKPADLAQAKAFIAANAPLAFYNDPEAKLPFELKPPAAGMPTTVIYGPDGFERGRISGQADWDQAGAKQVIDKLLAK